MRLKVAIDCCLRSARGDTRASRTAQQPQHRAPLPMGYAPRHPGWPGAASGTGRTALEPMRADALRSGKVLAVRFSHDHDSHGPVSLRIHDLHPGGGVARVPGSVENRAGIILLRLMIKDKHDFAAGIDGGVVIVAKLRRGDAEAGKDDGRGKIHRMLVSSRPPRGHARPSSCRRA